MNKRGIMFVTNVTYQPIQINEKWCPRLSNNDIMPSYICE